MTPPRNGEGGILQIKGRAQPEARTFGESRVNVTLSSAMTECRGKRESQEGSG